MQRSATGLSELAAGLPGAVFMGDVDAHPAKAAAATSSVTVFFIMSCPANIVFVLGPPR